MRLIKRYPNRKLYDTEAKKYIKLGEIADHIRNGEEIRVVDNASGEDLTALTLTQVIFEKEKEKGGFFPRSVLAELIQAGGDRLNALQRSLVSPKAFLQQVDEEIKRRVQALVGEGELPESEGKRLLEKLVAQGKQTPLGSLFISEKEIEKEVEQALAGRDIPTRQDLERLIGQLDSLSAQLDELDQSKT